MKTPRKKKASAPRPPTTTAGSPRDGVPETAARAAIVRAAQDEFLRYGLRKTSMEGIARSAQVAKATVYAYFADKEAVFDEVCARLSGVLQERSNQAAAAAASPREAVLASLCTKFCAIHAMAHTSPHAGELLNAAMTQANNATAAAHREYVSHLAGLLRRLPDVSPRQAAALAEALDRAAEGITQKASSPDEVRAHLGLLLGFTASAHGKADGRHGT